MKKNNTFLILNSLTLIFALIMNYLSSTKVFGSKNVGEISEMFPNLFTPANYAFAIWGVIYLFLIALVVYLWIACYGKNEDEELGQIALWFTLANLANGFWVIAWLNLYIGLSAIFIVILLVSLIAITLRLGMNTTKVRKRIVTWVRLPITIYLGWVIVATVANMSAFGVSRGWYGGDLSQSTWTIIMISAATLIYLLLLYFRNIRETALVGIWALIAIAVKQWGQEQQIVCTALIASAVLVLTVGIHALKKSNFKKTAQ